MIVDSHTHLFPPEVRRNRPAFCRRDAGFGLLYGTQRARMAGLDDLLQAMDRDGVGRSVICGFPWEDPGLCREGNDYLLQCFHQVPDRVIPFACLPPGPLRDARRELERCLSLGMRGVGELALYRRAMTSADVRRLAAVAGALSGSAMPLLLHAGEPVGHEYPGKDPRSLQSIYQLLLLLPEVRVILAHWGGGFFFYELMPEVSGAARNVFYDTAASPFLYRPEIYPLAVKIIGAERILFGSDFPLLPAARYFREISGVSLPAKAREKIEGLNAERLFGIRTGVHSRIRLK
jgi:predicted TIM-barrel fold metal-dependent hydrolase